ncbi:MAG: CRISPR-associated helicase Cas3' [Kiritimatiellae bacterium]|nr:CRISPR-associated helicase Cas3' [Kiritimatiellia bacterium]
MGVVKDISYAHSSEHPKKDWQSLEQHALCVAAICAGFSKIFSASEWGYAAGMLHDLGKARKPFQEMLAGLRTKGSDTQHAVYGAKAAFDKESLPLAFIVAGHHAGLHDIADLQEAVGKISAEESTALVQSSTGASIRFPHDNTLPKAVLNALVALPQNTLPLEYFTRMLFSCLIDADRLDSAFWEKLGEDTTRLSNSELPLNTTALLACVNAERERKRSANPDSPLSAIRNKIFDSSVTASDKPQGFFSLTVPTGGGKTLAAMAFALAHAKKHNLRRIIVVIPYLSIIEQNAAEYRRILDPDKKGIVLECHSSVSPPRHATNDEVSKLELVSENWDAPIIITTSVQFIESLFAASPSRARKLHNIADAVVIFDEVQTLPLHLLSPMLSVFRELVTNYGVSFVLSSATQPAFRHSINLPDGFYPEEITEVAPNPLSLFAELRRVVYKLPKQGETLSWDELSKHLVAAEQCLCVVNLTRHARVLWDKLNDKLKDKLGEGIKYLQQRPIHLSSAMCPAHRLAIIRKIRRRLKSGEPCRVISTQLVEAGVDVDFPVVWRAMGPLDSIVQVAGRCNREGKLPEFGTVHIFTPDDNKLPQGIYSTATGQAAITLGRLGSEASLCLATDPSIFTQYFSELFQLSNTDTREIMQDRKGFRFRTVAEKAVVIKDSGIPVVIPIGYGRHHVDRLRSRIPKPGTPRFTRDDLRKLQRYMVNVRQHDFIFFQQRCLLTEILPNIEIFVLDIAQYNRYIGVIKPDDAHPLEEFLG